MSRLDLESVAAALTAARGRVPVMEARILLGHVLGWSHVRLASYPEQALTCGDQERFERLLERRERGEPVAYLTGRCEFYGRPFRVDPNVLIPRPETELLVDVAVEIIGTRAAPKILDLGTGSGVLAVTLALELPEASVTAVTLLVDALAVARANADSLNAQVRFVQGDWFAAVTGERFDLIVANPPYVAANDPHLSQGDLRFEPGTALTDGSADGLDSLRRIIANAPQFLNSDGALVVEHGYDQAQAVIDLLGRASFQGVGSRRDLSGVLRVAVGSSPDVGDSQHGGETAHD